MGLMATSSGSLFLLVSVLAALAYGWVLQFRPSSLFRTLVKTLAVAALGLWSFMAGARPLLTAALGLSALGDAFLAGDPKRWLPLGLGSFLVAHILYTAFFLEIGDVGLFARAPWRLAAPVGAALAGIGVVVRLWRDFGALKSAVLAYMLAIIAMVATSFSLDATRWSAMAGALAFMSSDGILSWRLFRRADQPSVLADHAVWWLYWTGQLGLAAAFLA